MDTLIQDIATEVKRRYYDGRISKITPNTVITVASEMQPDFDWEDSDLIFQIMMKI